MKLAFIGAGNMANAIITGVVASKTVNPTDIFVYNPHAEKAEALEKSLGVKAFSDVNDMIEKCDMAFLAVKPNVVKSALDKSREALKGKALLSIAAGWTIDALMSAVDESTRVLRVMPNTPALCMTGMTAMSKTTSFTDEEKDFAERVFSSLGLCEWVKEELIDATIGVSGSSPAYVCMFIEALADAGVLSGLTRAQSVRMAAQAVKGTAELILKTGRHPGDLKDMVCSPGGTTIEAVRVLEDRGLRSCVINAAVAAVEKAKRL